MTRQQTAQEAIEMISTEDLSKWASRHDRVVIDALKAAIHAEQAVGPVAWLNRNGASPMLRSAKPTEDCGTVVERWMPLYLHPVVDHVPDAGETSERAELVRHLRVVYKRYSNPSDLKAADMLEADAQQVAEKLGEAQ